jgi:hypothetical protein
MSIFSSMLAIQEELTAITKDQRNGQQGWKFRGVDDVMNTLHPILVKHKVFACPKVLDIQRSSTVSKKEITYNGRTEKKDSVLNYATATVEYKFYDESGESISVTVVGEGMDSGDKATSKALSIAYKYAMFQTFCIPTEDDPDKDVYEAAVPTNDYSVQKIDVAVWLAEKQLNEQQRKMLEELDRHFDIGVYNKIKDKVNALPKKE